MRTSTVYCFSDFICCFLVSLLASNTMSSLLSFCGCSVSLPLFSLFTYNYSFSCSMDSVPHSAQWHQSMRRLHMVFKLFLKGNRNVMSVDMSPFSFKSSFSKSSSCLIFVAISSYSARCH